MQIKDCKVAILDERVVDHSSISLVHFGQATNLSATRFECLGYKTLIRVDIGSMSEGRKHLINYKMLCVRLRYIYVYLHILWIQF